MYFRWVCYINPFFYCMMGTMKNEYQHYLYPHGRPKVSERDELRPNGANCAPP